MTDRCEGRYPVPTKRDEPFPVTYRCGLHQGHLGECGSGNAPAEPPLPGCDCVLDEGLLVQRGERCRSEHGDESSPRQPPSPEGMTVEQIITELEKLRAFEQVGFEMVADSDDKPVRALDMAIAALRRSADPPEPCPQCAALQATIDRLVAINTRLESAAPPVGETVIKARAAATVAACMLNGREERLRIFNYKLDALIDAVRVSALHAQTWQPIETAPKDGTQVWLWWAGKRRLAHWHEAVNPPSIGGKFANWLPDDKGSVPAHSRPTLWCALPSPPELALPAQRDEQTKDIP